MRLTITVNEDQGALRMEVHRGLDYQPWQLARTVSKALGRNATLVDLLEPDEAEHDIDAVHPARHEDAAGREASDPGRAASTRVDADWPASPAPTVPAPRCGAVRCATIVSASLIWKRS